MDELMRGDSAGRANYYREALQNGWMSSNEVRNKERMNPVEGGDIITKQVNQIPLTQLQAYGEKISTDAGAQG
jgi:phage portal protein BeeE